MVVKLRDKDQAVAQEVAEIVGKIEMRLDEYLEQEVQEIYLFHIFFKNREIKIYCLTPQTAEHKNIDSLHENWSQWFIEKILEKIKELYEAEDVGWVVDLHGYKSARRSETGQYPIRIYRPSTFE